MLSCEKHHSSQQTFDLDFKTWHWCHMICVKPLGTIFIEFEILNKHCRHNLLHDNRLLLDLYPLVDLALKTKILMVHSCNLLHDNWLLHV